LFFSFVSPTVELSMSPEHPARSHAINDCWARCLGECSDKMSKEHIVTEAVLPESILVRGLHWCAGQPVEIGKANFTRKILCTKHNSMLSAQADQGAIAMVKAFHQGAELESFRKQYKRTQWTRRQFKVPGRKLESWFLKTLINVVYGQSITIGENGDEPGVPPRDLVEIAFGLRRFSDPAGLYTVAIIGDGTPNDGSAEIITLGKRKDNVNGAIFHFGGLTNLLYLDNDNRPNPQNFLGHKYPRILQSKFMYHLYSAKYCIHDRLSHSIDFDWR
jgi:hypothetical protein